MVFPKYVVVKYSDRRGYAKCTDRVTHRKVYVPFIRSTHRRRLCRRIFDTATEAIDYHVALLKRCRELNVNLEGV